MRRIVLAIVSLACAFAARADYVIKQTVESARKTHQIVMKIKDAKVRIDTADQNTALFDSKSGEETILLHQKKAYLKVSAEQIKSRAEAMKRALKQNDQKSADIELKPTGKKETIQGYEAEEYTTNVAGVPVTILIAKSYPDYQKFLESLNSIYKASPLQSSLSIPPNRYPGMPMRTEVELSGQKLTTTLDLAEETNLAEDEFVVPADYKEINASQLQGK
jgi:hypothetical protein